MKRIRSIATALLVPAALFGLLYPAFGLWGTWRYAWFEPNLWLMNRWFEPGAQLATGTRLVYGVLWSVPAVFGGLAMAMAVGCLLRLRQGLLFDALVATRVRAMGIFVMLSSLTQIGMMGLTPTLISWHNPSGTRPPYFFYSSETIGLVFCGLGFWLIGWILNEAIRIAEENDTFI